MYFCLSSSCKSDTNKIFQVVTSGGHRAGFDAFMTGYSFLSHLVHSTKKADLATMLLPGSNAAMSELKNKVHLSYKTKPLVVFKSNFAKVSQAHATKLASINATTEKQSSTGDGFYFMNALKTQGSVDQKS